MAEGVKHDGLKVRYDLDQPLEEEQTQWVRTFGAIKYDDDNWIRVPGARGRYYAAARRHLGKWKRGEVIDDEFRLPHLAHAICCLYYLMWFDNEAARATASPNVPMPTPEELELLPTAEQAAVIAQRIIEEKQARVPTAVMARTFDEAIADDERGELRAAIAHLQLVVPEDYLPELELVLKRVRR